MKPHPAIYERALARLGRSADEAVFIDDAPANIAGAATVGLHTIHFTPGKNFPATGGCGPWLVTTDEIPDPAELRLATRVNGEVLQAAPVSDLCFGVRRIIEYCSGFCVLNPGDIIATGTPSGVGFARQPPRWLKPGDTVEVEVSGIGILQHRVADEVVAS